MSNKEIKEFVIDDDNILYIALFNKWNSFCYHTSSVQLLHSSKTLNKCLKERTIENKLAKLLLTQNQLYANITEDNYREVFFAIRDSYENLVDNYLDDYAKDGYSPTYLLLYFLFPAIHEAFPDEYETILRELNYNSPECPLYNAEYIVEKHPFLKAEYQDEILELNKRTPGFRHHGNFKGGIMEVFPTLDAADGGHAMFILKTRSEIKPTFYVFDDSNCIDEFRSFVSSRKIAKIILRNIDDTSIHQLEQLWGEHSFSARMNGSWEISNATGTHNRQIDTINKGFEQLKKRGSMERNGIGFAYVSPWKEMEMKTLGKQTPKINPLQMKGGNRRFWRSQTSIGGMDEGQNSFVKEADDKGKLSAGFIFSIILNFILVIVIIVDVIFAVKNYKQYKGCATPGA